MHYRMVMAKKLSAFLTVFSLILDLNVPAVVKSG